MSGHKFDYCCHQIERKDCDQCSRAIPAKAEAGTVRSSLADYVEFEQATGCDIRLSDAQAELIVATLRRVAVTSEQICPSCGHGAKAEAEVQRGAK